MHTRTHRAARVGRAAGAHLSRIITAALALVALALAGAAVASAQPVAPSARRGGFELRPFAGAYLPTGDQRDVLRDAFHLGAQASYPVIPQLAVVGTFARSASKDRVARGEPSVDVFHYDAGVEGRAAAWRRGATWDFTPFAGVGLGGRTYRVRRGEGDAETKFAGHGALGGEVGLGRLGVRVGARDYLSRAAPAEGRDASGTRNDVTLAAGLTVRFW